MDPVVTQEIRDDGALVNLFSGAGVAGRDRKLGNQVAFNRFLSEAELEQLYLCGLIRRFVDAIPEAMLRHRPTIKLSAEEDTKDTIPAFETFLKNTSFAPALCEVMRLQRIYGGAGLVLLIDDGLPAEAPVDANRVRAVRGYAPLSRHELIPSDTTFNDYSKPEFYQITTNQRLSPDQEGRYLNVKIHHTRVARFDGLYLPQNIRSRNTGWGQSVIEIIWDAWQDYYSSISGLGSLIGEGDLLVHKIPGLMQRIAAGGEADIRKRLELNNMSRSVYGTSVLDTEESLENLSRNLTNISSATDPFVKQLQAVTGWPASILMGDSPGGLGKEGRFEERVWASLVEAWQTVYCGAPITQIFDLILRSAEGPAKGRPPEDWAVDFPSVYTVTDEERADLQSKMATSDNTYVQLGVLHPFELRNSRFGGTEFSIDTTLNDAITEQMAAQAEAQFAAQQAQLQAAAEAAAAQPAPDEAPAEPGAEGGTPEDALAEAGGLPEPDRPEATTDAAAGGPPYEHYEAHGLRIRVTHTAGAVRAGHMVGPDGQRTDTSSAAPLLIFGPLRTASRLYQARFEIDSALVDGPYVTGFASLRAAKRGVASLFPRQTVAGLSPISDTATQALRASWDTY